MKKSKQIKQLKHQLARQRYQYKRARRFYKVIRRRRVAEWLLKNPSLRDIKEKDKREYKNLPAPRNFSFVNNTERMLDYLHQCHGAIRNKKPINIDISRVTKMTPDSIAVVISTITNPVWNHKVTIRGNAPDDIKLRRLFIESGFYNYVKSDVGVRVNNDHLMHKETSRKVQPEIAGRAVGNIVNGNNLSEEDTDAIYSIFIELMSNTLHHADLSKYGVSNWWLYVCNEGNKKQTSVTFIDLGVGIFKSLRVRSYIKSLGVSFGMISNIDFVSDLLSGKIGSRIDQDQEIRGKGIPQIVKSAKLDCFSKFYIITNDVKMDLKNNEYVKLTNKFRGTFIYFELYKADAILYGSTR